MPKAQNTATSRNIMELTRAAAAQAEQALAANSETRSLVEQLIAEQASKRRAPKAPSVHPQWGERPLSGNERNAIEALVWYKAEELGIKPRTVEAAAEAFFAVEELSQLKAWDYDGVIRYLVDFDAGNPIQPEPSDRASLSLAGE
jgi:hypothetical protein